MRLCEVIGYGDDYFDQFDSSNIKAIDWIGYDEDSDEQTGAALGDLMVIFQNDRKYRYVNVPSGVFASWIGQSHKSMGKYHAAKIKHRYGYEEII